MDTPAPTFEENYTIIAGIVERLRSQWTFKASVMRDFDDVKSEIIIHIWKKWALYDSARPLGGWVATIAKNQFWNILRDIYLSTSSPCSRCVCNLGGDVCSLFGSTSSMECAQYRKWHETKRLSHEARLPVSLENHLDEAHTQPDTHLDLERAMVGLHDKMQGVLTKSEWGVYKKLFLEHKSEEATAQELGFKMTEHGRKIGAKRVRQVRALVVLRAKELILEHGLEGL